MIAAALAVCAPSSRAEDALSPAQSEQVEKLIHDYLLRHPEVISEALKELEAREQRETVASQQKAISTRRAEIFDDPKSPAAGNLSGPVTIVEFFDYRCPYCKAMAKDLLDAIEADGHVRIVFKDFPILGPQSVYAAQAALAAQLQGKYRDFHLAMMTHKGQLDDATVMALAEKVGLDTARLKTDMEAPAVAEAITHNYDLAEALNIRGTPAFVIGDQVIPGAMTVEELKKLIDSAKSG